MGIQVKSIRQLSSLHLLIFQFILHKNMKQLVWELSSYDYFCDIQKAKCSNFVSFPVLGFELRGC
jgi:hypothetical protein